MLQGCVLLLIYNMEADTRNTGVCRTRENTDDIPVRDVRKAPYLIILTSVLSPFHHARPSSLQICPDAQRHDLKEDPVIRVLS